MNGIAYADRAEWLEARRQGIGGSDAAAILGVSRFSTAYDVWEEKVVAKPERVPTPRMMWGRRLEDVVAEALVEERGLRLRRSNRILVHPELPFVIGSVDRLTRDAVVEIKVSRSGDAWATEKEAPDLDPVDRVPRDYYVQGQHYAAVTGKPRVLFGVLVGGNDLRLLETPRDDAFVDDLLEEESAFWHNHVETGIAPPLVAADAGRLARMFPYGSGEKVATPEIDQVVAELLEVRDHEDQWSKRRAALEVRVKEYLAEASDLVAPSGRVTWRNSERTTVGWEPYAKALERIVREVAPWVRPDWMTGKVGVAVPQTDDPPLSREVLPFLPATPAEYGPGLDGLRDIYTTTSSVRTFRLDRKAAR